MGRVPDDRDRRHRASLAALIGPPQTARDLTVVEHLQFVAATWGTSAAAARETAQALLEEFAITSLARRFPHELSSGQSQLVADRKSTRLNSSHVAISYAVFCLKKKISSRSTT